MGRLISPDIIGQDPDPQSLKDIDKLNASFNVFVRPKRDENDILIPLNPVEEAFSKALRRENVTLCLAGGGVQKNSYDIIAIDDKGKPKCFNVVMKNDVTIAHISQISKNELSSDSRVVFKELGEYVKDIKQNSQESTYKGPQQ